MILDMRIRGSPSAFKPYVNPERNKTGLLQIRHLFSKEPMFNRPVYVLYVFEALSEVVDEDEEKLKALFA